MLFGTVRPAMRIPSIRWVLAFAAMGSSGAVELQKQGETTTAVWAGGQLRVVAADRGARVAAITIGGRQLLRHGVCLWSVELRDREGRRVLLNSDMGRPRIEATESEVRLLWSGLHPEDAPTAEVAVTVSIAVTGGRLAWRIEFLRIPPEWTVFQYLFPRFALAADLGDSCALIEPSDWGLLTRDPLRRLPSAPRRYPGSSAAMQFYGLQRGGDLLYLGCHDPRARAKQFLLDADVAERSLTFAIRQPTRLHYGRPYRQEYPFVMKWLTGDWYDAAMLYREWALTAPWTWRGPLHAGRKTPRRYVETPVVLMRLGQESCDPAFAAAWAIRMQKWFGVPVAFHWYNWHRSFGSSSIDAYPEYFPARPGFREAAAAMREAGVQTMPYLNARLWRTDLDSWHELGRRAAVRDPYGNIHREVWMKIPTATMNPASRLWRWVIGEAALRCFDAGCSAVYLDQLAESAVWPSYDPNHPHPPGETASWVQGYGQLCESIRAEARDIDPDAVLAAEGNAEPYMACIDAFLTGNLNAANSIPLYSAVYHDYVMQFGRYVMAEDLALPRAVLAKFGQQFIYGGQFGWSRAFLERFLRNRPAQAAGLRKMAKLRAAYPDLLAAGRMLRPLDLSGQVSVMEVEWYQWTKRIPVPLPEVLNSVWQNARGEIGVLLLNLEDTARTVRIELSAEAYPLAGTRQAELSTGTEAGIHTVRSVRDGAGWRVTVPALSPALLRIPGTPPAYPDPPPEPGFDLLGTDLGDSIARAVLPFRVPQAARGRPNSEAFPFRYEADVMPAAARPRWYTVGNALGALALSGGILTIDTLRAEGPGAILLRIPRGPFWDVDAQVGFTVEIRLQVVECNDNPRFAFWLQANTESGLMDVQLFPDKIVARGQPAVAADLASGFRTVRLVGLPGGGSCRVFLDGEAIVEQAPYLGGTPHQSGLAFGTGASAGRVRARVDWVRFHPALPVFPR